MSHVYLGTSDFAATVLLRLNDSDRRPALVVSPPDRPRGRGRQVQPPPVAEAARELEIELLQTADVNEPDSLARIRAAEPDAGAVCAFGQLIRDPLLSEIPMLNAHPSLLPRWRGAAPIERAMMAHDETTGVSVIRLVEALDAGPIALSESLAIGAAESFGELADRLAELAGELLVRALDLQAGGELVYTDQDEGAASYAEKIGPEDRRLDPSRPAVELADQVRALTPHVGAFLVLDGGERIGVSGARVEAGTREAPAPRAGAGSLAVAELAFEDDVLRLGTAVGALVLTRIQPAGGRAMSPAEYLRGHELPERAAVGASLEDARGAG